MVNYLYITDVSSNTTLSFDYDTYIVDASGGNITLTLPEILGDGQTFLFIRLDTTGNTVTLDCHGSETINGDATATIPTMCKSMIFTYGGEWKSTVVAGSVGLSRNNIELSFSPMSSVGINYIQYSAQMISFLPVITFNYKGSTHYGGIPISLKMVYSGSPTLVSTDLAFRLVDKNSNQVVASGVVNIPVNIYDFPLTTATVTQFYNVPASETVLEFQCMCLDTGATIKVYNVCLNV